MGIPCLSAGRFKAESPTLAGPKCAERLAWSLKMEVVISTRRQ
jgi:hypothetical protein